jgi:hypothetical protein
MRNVFTSLHLVFSPALVAAKHGHSGGLTVNEKWLIALAVVAILAFLFGRSTESGPRQPQLTAEQEAERQRENQDYLNRHLLSVEKPDDYRHICAWMAQRSLYYQEPLKDAYIAVCAPETDTVENDEREL